MMKLKPNEIASGAIGENKSKKHSRAPDFTGSINTELGNFRISVWKMTNDQGEDFISFSITDPEVTRRVFPRSTTEDKRPRMKMGDWLSPLFKSKDKK